MDAEVKQRNRRRKRAQRMQQAAQRESKITSKGGDSAEEDSESTVRREKPQRPLIRRKKSKEPLVEEDIIDGFSILGFKSYDDLESVIKLAGKDVKRLLDEKAPRHETRPHITHHISAHPTPVHGLTLTHQDPGTSDDSGRASERLTGSSVPTRDADSSRDRLSDASSRCSSGKGYICDSEGEDDKGSDASSVIFGSVPASRKHEFPGALPPSLPLSNGTSNSPVPAPTPPTLPTPSPAPAQQPPTHPIANQRTGTTTVAPVAATVTTVPSGIVTIPSSTTVPMTMPQPAAAPVAHHPPAFVSKTNHGRTESPAVATSANAAVAPGGNSTAGGQYHHPTFQPLYAPYAVHSTFSSPSSAPPVTSVPTTSVPTCQQPSTTVISALPPIVSSHRDSLHSRTSSPKVHSPSRERESYSNVSSLSRSSVTSINCPPPTTVPSSLATKSWSGSSATRLSPAPPRPTPPLHSSFPAPMFTTPLPPPATTSSSLTSTGAPPPSNPNPFSAESLFQSNQADMLRRELDNRFLASQDRSLNIGPPPYLRAEMHQHQHHHTHVHQHTTSILPQPPPSASTIFPPPLVSQFKEIPKLGGMDSSFYRQNMGLPGYPGYSPGILHSGLTGPTPFVPPNHLPPFQPKPTPQPDPTKPKIVKSGKWNAMHVRIAWEVYHHQQKESKGGTVKPDLLRTPSHLFPPSVPFSRPHDIQFPPSLSNHRPPTFEQGHPGIFGSSSSHLGNTLSPFARYGAGFGSGGSPFGVSPLVSRDLPLSSLHDPWRGLQRSIPVFPHSVNSLPSSVTGLPPPGPWSLKPDPVLEQREREERERAERERERLRREREERERREREEKQRKIEQQQQQERERERREKERREHERREMERQQERERLLHQQRLVESTKQLGPSMLRDRSPMRNGTMDPNEIRIKEEPRIKEDDRYHPYVRQHHPGLQHGLPQMMDRSRVLPPPYPPPSAHWPPHADPYYRAYEPLRYNPLVDAAMRAEEERVKLFSAYQHHAQFRPKDPGLLHLRAGSGPGPPPPAHKMCATPPTDLHKKEEPR